MRISVLTIGAIASILSINSVFATTSTVTSKDYVDTALETKQDLIEVSGGGWYYGWQPEATLVSSSGSEDGDVTGNQYGILDAMGDGIPYYATKPSGDIDYAETFREFITDEDGDGLSHFTVPNTYFVGAAVSQVNYDATMRCAGWPDGVQHTDENCWLWYKTANNQLSP